MALFPLCVDIVGEPAHEMIHNPLAWLTPNPPSMPRPFVMNTVHAVCRNGGECRYEIDRTNAELARDMGVPPPVNASPAKLGPSHEPLCATCAQCNKLVKVKKCGKCKTIRYCGKECQKADYDRHKKICKTIKKVQNDAPPLSDGKNPPNPFAD